MLCFPQIHANILEFINEIAMNDRATADGGVSAIWRHKRNSTLDLDSFEAIKGKMLTDALRILRAR